MLLFLLDVHKNAKNWNKLNSKGLYKKTSSLLRFTMTLRLQEKEFNT